jgi:hypothetical protein
LPILSPLKPHPPAPSPHRPRTPGRERGRAEEPSPPKVDSELPCSTMFEETRAPDGFRPNLHLGSQQGGRE